MGGKRRVTIPGEKQHVSRSTNEARENSYVVMSEFWISCATLIDMRNCYLAERKEEREFVILEKYFLNYC
jgi:cytidine deaminase